MTNGSGSIVEHRLDAEGVDPLLLAGVNDAHLQQLVRFFGIRVLLRGDHVILSAINPETIAARLHQGDPIGGEA